MKITLRPYAHDHTRWHIDIRLMHPTADNTQKELRKRLVAPAGLGEAQARAWAERQVPQLLLAAVKRSPDDAPGQRDKEAPPPSFAPPAPPPPAASSHLRPVPPARQATMTLAELYTARFEPEYVRLQKPGTAASYEHLYRNHIGPGLGALPIAAIDEDRLSAFRAHLRQRLCVSTSNIVLSKVAKILRFARKIRLIDTVPEIEKFSVPRARPKAVLSDEEIAALVKAAAAIDTTHELIVLLALDAGLRSSEICALEWTDIDLKAGSITVQNNTFRGTKQTPKGTIGKIALTSALRGAIERHRRHEPLGPLVLYRPSYPHPGPWRPFSLNTLRYALNQAQSRAGLRKTGPHLLRHTALTRLANLGASVYIVQAVARHSRLQTTQTYLHTQQVGLAREAADLLDQAAGRIFGKNLAKRATPRQKRR